MPQPFKIHFCVPDGYNFMMAELYYGGEYFAELNTESGSLQVIIYPLPSGESWSISAEDLIEGLEDAKSRFQAKSAFFGPLAKSSVIEVVHHGLGTDDIVPKQPHQFLSSFPSSRSVESSTLDRSYH